VKGGFAESIQCKQLCSAALLVGDALVIVFRGTKTQKEAYACWDFDPMALEGLPDGVGVHRGIYSLTERTLKKIADGVRGKVNGVKRVVFTGHSLGGGAALAAQLMMTLAPSRARLMAALGVEAASVESFAVTFGAPFLLHVPSDGQAGDAVMQLSEVKAKLDATVLAYVHAHDPIPRLQGPKNICDPKAADAFVEWITKENRANSVTLFGTALGFGDWIGSPMKKSEATALYGIECFKSFRTGSLRDGALSTALKATKAYVPAGRFCFVDGDGGHMWTTDKWFIEGQLSLHRLYAERPSPKNKPAAKHPTGIECLAAHRMHTYKETLSAPRLSVPREPSSAEMAWSLVDSTAAAWLHVDFPLQRAAVAAFDAADTIATLLASWRLA
jgi:hypothetical protein